MDLTLMQAEILERLVMDPLPFGFSQTEGPLRGRRPEAAPERPETDNPLRTARNHLQPARLQGLQRAPDHRIRGTLVHRHGGDRLVRGNRLPNLLRVNGVRDRLPQVGGCTLRRVRQGLAMNKAKGTQPGCDREEEVQNP